MKSFVFPPTVNVLKTKVELGIFKLAVFKNCKWKHYLLEYNAIIRKFWNKAILTCFGFHLVLRHTVLEVLRHMFL